MKGKIFVALLISFFSVGALVALTNSTLSLKGKFPLGNWWSGDGGTIFSGGGFPGAVDFNVGSGQILADGTLSGAFWLGNVSWATFSHGVAGYIPSIACPSDIWNNATQPCPMVGYAWSQNAGWIALSATDIGTGSGVYFNPNTGNIEWWGWSRSLGWIPMWTSISGSLLPTTTTTVDPLAWVPINFVSKIAIVGNIAGSRVFSVANNGTTNQDVGYSYKTINHANILNMINRNIALMSRNIDDVTLDTASSPHQFIIRKWSDYRIESGWNVPLGKRSIIVIGGNIVIDQIDVNSLLWANPSIALIALKDASGNGWDIVISDKAKRIYAYLYAEGTIFSGEKASNVAPIVKYSNTGIWNIPQNQLYIRGFMASKNTIGGSQQKPTPICPALVIWCNQANVYSYDWDYFRTYDPLKTLQYSLPSERSGVARLQWAAMIIEYDPTILTDPPPWLRETR